MCELGAFLRQGFIVEFLRLLGVEDEIELIAPAEFEARFGQRVVAQLRAGVALGEVGDVRGKSIYFVSVASGKTSTRLASA